MFNLRSGAQGASGASQPPTIEVIRQRARHRLIGASVLVLAGVVGFSLLFDTQPRPIVVDVPIDIPAKQTTPPLALPAASPKAVKVDGLDPREEAVTPSASTAGAEPVPSATASSSAAPAKAEPPVAAATPSKAPPPAAAVVPAPAQQPAPKAPTAEAARAQALLEGKAAAPAAARVVVQVGAFAEQARAQEVRGRLERAGLKTYTHVAETAEGKRIRVRVGPFDSRAEAEKAADKVKTLGLPAAILTL